MQRLIGTFYLLEPKLVFHNSDLDKSTTAPPFVRWGIWNIHVHKVRVYEVYAYEVQAYEVRACYTPGVQAYEVHAHVRP
jgi:hypothetical protein